MNKIIFIHLILILLAIGCNDQQPLPENGPPPTNLTVTPGAFEISILQPATNGTPIAGSTVMSGHCGKPQFPITIVGNGMTVYSVCQNDYTWASPVSGKNAGEGGVSFAITLRELNLSGGSPTITRSYIKNDASCEVAANLGKLFANFGDAGVDGVSVPYKICTPAQFFNIRFHPSKKFVLARDIDFGQEVNAPVNTTFTGELDGHGFYLKDFIIRHLLESSTSVGLFRVAQNATIKNLNILNGLVESGDRVGMLAGDWRGTGLIENVKLTGSVTATGIAGGLVGLANTASALNIKNVQAQLTVTSTGSNVGGTIGYILTNDGSLNIENSEFRTTVTGVDFVGGVVGQNQENATTLTNVTHRGTVSSSGIHTGGLVGLSRGGSFNLVKHIGAVTASKDNVDVFVGGLIGKTLENSTINSCYVVANISSGGNHTGGLVGQLFGGNVTGSYSRGSLVVDENQYNGIVANAGGLFGSTATNTTISQSYSQMQINARAQVVGGLVGTMNGVTSAIQDSYSTGIVKGNTRLVGGLVGDFKGQSISESYSRATVTIDTPTPNAYVGGLVGYALNPAATYSRLYFSGALSATNGTADIVGGLFGYLRGASLKETYVSGTVTGARSRVGGLFGQVVDTAVSASFFSGALSASLREVGGIAGAATNGSISDVFVTGIVQSAGNLGGLVGYQAGNNNLTNGYFSGSLFKTAISVETDANIGRLLGLRDSSTVFTNVFYYDLSPAKRLVDNSNLLHNGFGVLKTYGQLRNQSDYTGFTFANSSLLFDWDMPAAGFKLPFQSSDFLFAAHDWMSQPNYGFGLPQVWSDDPLTEVLLPVLDTYGGLLTTLGQEEYDTITATTAATTVTPGQLQVSILDPASDGQSISTKRLVYGECGVAGGLIKLTGSFTLNTVCQSNNRWAALIDATSKPSGNLTLTAQLMNQAQTSSSPTVTRIFVKGNSLCSDTVALQGTFANSHLNGNGTTVPYLLCTSAQLRNIGYYPTLKFELANDLDFANAVIQPLRTTFKGTLDGKGFRVRNFTINMPTTSGVGFFESAEDAVVKNISFERFSITGYQRTGVLAGTWRKNGTIQNVSILNGSVTGVTNWTGGLIGIANTTSTLALSNITTQGLSVTGKDQTGGLIGIVSTTDGSFQLTDSTLGLTVHGLNYIGGVVGQLLQPNAVMTNVTVNGNVSADKTYLGGVVGEAHSGTFTSVKTYGNVSSPWKDVDVFVGGVFGMIRENSTITGSQYSGLLSAAGNFVGGIVGRFSEGTISNNLSQGTLTVSSPTVGSIRSRVGGIAGGIGKTVVAPAIVPASHMINTSSSMIINAHANQLGGLVGEFAGPQSTLKNSFSSGAVTGRNSLIGGLVGFFHGVEVSDCYASGNVAIVTPTPNAYVGGLIGYSNSKIANHQRLWASGNVIASSGTADYLGGLFGYFRAGTLSDSYATGNVSGGRNSNGGLVGMHRGVLLRSFATGNVSAGLRHNGGLVGYLNIGVALDPVGQPGVNTIDPLIENCYALGSVTGGGSVATDVSGGLVGYVNLPGLTNRVKNSYTRSTLLRLADATMPISSLGSIYGGATAASMLDLTSLYYLDTIVSDGQTAQGLPLTAAQMSIPTNYAFDFIAQPGWRMPAAATNVPGYGVNFPWPTLSWVGIGSTIDQHTVRGSVTGLAHSQVRLQLNMSEEITLNAGATSFAFNSQVQAGQSYSVSISAQPNSPSITCTLANANGTMANVDVTNLVLTCPTFQALAINSSTSAMAVGASQPLTVSATLSNSIIVDVTSQSTLSTSGAHFSIAGANLTANSVGSTTITANFLTLSQTKNFNSFSAPNAPTTIAWQGTSPSATPTLTAQWTISTTTPLASQRIEYFANGNCSGSAVSTKTLATSAVSDTYTGIDAQNYSFRVAAVDSNSLAGVSSCSSPMLVSLPNPAPVSGTAIAQSWLRGALPLSSPLTSWSNPAGITNVKVALGTTVGGSNLKAWAAAGNVTSYSFTAVSGLTACAPVYASIRTVNSYNKESTVVSTAPWYWDNVLPAAPVVSGVTGIASENVTVQTNWSASSDNCQLAHYEYAVGTSPGNTDVIAWQNVGTNVSFQAINGAGGLNFSLTDGVNYYSSVRAVDAAGNRSLASVSNAWQLPVASLAKIFWFDASAREEIRDRADLTPNDVGFANRVAAWRDLGTAGTYDAFGVNTTGDAGFDSTLNHVTFNGTNQYLRIPTGTSFDNATFNHKSAIVSFKTSTDITSRQVIFEQGTSSRGLNLYILAGKLYCGFWNTSNGGDGAQAILSQNTNITTDTTYHAAVVLDYTNYTTATGPSGVVRCYLNATQMGADMATTSRLFAQSNSAAFGATYNGTRYHDSTTTATGSYFAGRILEAFSLNQVVTPVMATSILNNQMAKWSSGSLSTPGPLALINNSTVTPSKATRASWQPISDPYFITDSYEIAIGTTPGGTEVLFWSNVGNVLSYEARDGVDGLNFSLLTGVDYFISVRAIDTFDNESQPAISSAWQVYPSASLQLAGTFLKLDASAGSTVLDGAGVNSETVGFANVVATWRNTINTTINNFTQNTVANRAAYVPAFLSVRFDQLNDSLSTPSEANITNAVRTQKAVTAVVAMGPDVTTRQFIYEQGSRSNRGMSIYVEAGNLYCTFHNARNDGDGAQPVIFQSIPVVSGESYVITHYLDYRNYTNATGPNGSVGCYVNGVLQGTGPTTSRLYADNSPVYLGVRASATWHNSNSTGTGDYFGGDILEVQITNTVPSNSQSYIDLHNALMNKWQ